MAYCNIYRWCGQSCMAWTKSLPAGISKNSAFCKTHAALFSVFSIVYVLLYRTLYFPPPALTGEDNPLLLDVDKALPVVWPALPPLVLLVVFMALLVIWLAGLTGIEVAEENGKVLLTGPLTAIAPGRSKNSKLLNALPLSSNAINSSYCCSY